MIILALGSEICRNQPKIATGRSAKDKLVTEWSTQVQNTLQPSFVGLLGYPFGPLCPEARVYLMGKI